jgi:hypothetical protein
MYCRWIRVMKFVAGLIAFADGGEKWAYGLFPRRSQTGSEGAPGADESIDQAL